MGCASCRAFWAVGIPERFCTLVAKLVLYGDRYAGSIAIASLRDFLAGTPQLLVRIVPFRLSKLPLVLICTTSHFRIGRG